MTKKTPELNKNKQVITNYLTRFLKQEKTQLAKLSLDDDIFYTLNNFLARGKMNRGSLLILAYSSFENKINNIFFRQVLLPMASALELIQAGLLVHDDIIDQDIQRRGQHSIWQHYLLQSQDNNRHYGESQAICLGDFCFFLANQLITKACTKLNQTKNSKKVEASDIQSLINREINQVIMAEMLDVQLAMKSQVPSLEEILEMYLYKTARYSFSLPLMLAGYLANQPLVIIQQISNIGEKIGLIFQIQDDYLGIFADNKTGKSILSDIREGKKTIFYYYLITNKQLKNEDKKFFNNCFGKQELEPKQTQKLKKLFENHSLPAINNDLKQLNQQALKQIDGIDNQNLKKLLKEILYLAKNRQH